MTVKCMHPDKTDLVTRRESI